MNRCTCPALATGMHLEYIPPDRPDYGVFGEIIDTTPESIVVCRYWHGNSGVVTLNGSIVLRLVKYKCGAWVPEPLRSQWAPLWNYRITAPSTLLMTIVGG